MPYLEAFHTMYPNIKLQMLNGTTSEICNFIKSGEVDIGFCNFPIEDSTLQLTVCTDIQDIFVCGEKYKTLASKSLSYEDLLKFPLIFLEKNRIHESMWKTISLQEVSILNPNLS